MTKAKPSFKHYWNEIIRGFIITK